MKTLAIIGSTGSIGETSLKIFKKNKKFLKLVSLVANTNIKKLYKQEKIYKPQAISLLKNNKSNSNLDFKKNFINKYKNKKIDFIISGIDGYESLETNFELLKVCKNLLIANKETIICGGDIFLKYAKKNNCNIIPIDSEHHCIDFFLKNFNFKNDIDKIYLCASGGPFFKKKLKHNEKIKNVLDHPTWKMGKKISVNSSTFANKVMELFEAKVLFNLKSNLIDIVVEETSNIHAIVQLKNKITFPIMHVTDMQIPISNSLLLKNPNDYKLFGIKFDLQKPCEKKFPLIKVGKKILSSNSHINMILFTVLNERLVNLFLENKIKYGDIVKTLVIFFNKKKYKFLKIKKISNIKDIIKTISYGKKIKI